MHTEAAINAVKRTATDFDTAEERAISASAEKGAHGEICFAVGHDADGAALHRYAAVSVNWFYDLQLNSGISWVITCKRGGKL